MPIKAKAIQKIETQTETTEEKKQTAIDKTVIKLLRYKGLTQDDDAFLILQDDTYAELRQVEGIGLQTLSPAQVSATLLDYVAFLRRYVEDITYITSLFPVETDEQINYWIQKYRKTKNPTQRHYITDRIHMLEKVHEQSTNQEYMLVIFADNEVDLRKNIDSIKSWGGHALKTHSMTRKKKEDKLFQINNMNVGTKEVEARKRNERHHRRGH